MAVKMFLRLFSGICAKSDLVTLNGQPLSLIPLSSTGNVTEYGADITAWAGQIATMAFTAFPQVPHNSVNTLFLDAVQFSPFSVPEPSPLSLFALGAFLILRAKRHSPYRALG
jgi:hypothetical protein